MSAQPLSEEPRQPFWARLGYGYMAYKMIQRHQANCERLHGEIRDELRQTREQAEAVRTEVGRLGTNVINLSGSIRSFTDMQPDLNSAVRERQRRIIIRDFMRKCAARFGGLVALVSGIIAIGVWLLPIIQAKLGVG